MNQTDGKRQRFEMLVEQSGLPQELIQAYFKDGYIEQVIVNKHNNDWTFCIRKTSLVPLQAYNGFTHQIRKSLHILQTHPSFLSMTIW